MFRRVSLCLLSRALNKGYEGGSGRKRMVTNCVRGTVSCCSGTTPSHPSLLSGLMKDAHILPLTSLKIQTPPNKSIQHSILDLPVIPASSVCDILPNVNIAVEEPCNTVEKHAARMIVIRRRKMKRHRLKKLRKRMKFEWAKIRQRRELRKEKTFQAELMAQIKEADRFDPQTYVADKIRKANEVLVPIRWRGKLYPDFIISRLMDRKEKKAQLRLERDSRRKLVDLDPSHYKY